MMTEYIEGGGGDSIDDNYDDADNDALLMVATSLRLSYMRTGTKLYLVH